MTQQIESERTTYHLRSLYLDYQNYRLPDDQDFDSQTELASFMETMYDVITIGESIASHGYFQSEPLIVVEENGRIITVEGNRRLTALKLLASDELREDCDVYPRDKWDSLAESSDIYEDTELPSILVPDRESVAPIIGYRHISGIEPWDPMSKARFLSSLVDQEEMAFEEVSNEVGDDENEVRKHYRDYKILIQMQEDFGVETHRAQEKFGVFTRAMNNPSIRGHINAPIPSNVPTSDEMMPQSKSDESEELISWIFGDETDDPVISESRDLTKLGQAMSEEEGIDELRRTRDLEEAFLASGGLADRLYQRLSKAKGFLEKSIPDMRNAEMTPDVTETFNQCIDAMEDLKSVFQGRTQDNGD